jgi:hypothetical protein
MYQVSRLDLCLSVSTTNKDSGSLSNPGGYRMTKDDKQVRDESGDPQLASEDMKVDLTPFEFLPMRLRGADPGPSQSASEGSSDGGGT